MWHSTALSITAGVIQQATDEQWKALRDNVVAEGHWENSKCDLIFMDHGTLFVRMDSILIGIEKDGYTHS
jgi:hypothetical protein